MNNSLKKIIKIIVIVNSMFIASCATANQVGDVVSTNGLQQKTTINNGMSIALLPQKNATRATKSSNKTIKPYVKVVNSQGVVGLAYKQVKLYDVAVDKAKEKLAPLYANRANINYVKHLDLTVLTFNSFNATVTAQQNIQALFPNAVVQVPTKFSVKRTK